MSKFTVMKIEDMESVYGGAVRRARASLEVTSFGMQVFDLPPNYADYPEHDEVGSKQEEVYVLLRGSAELIVDGESHQLEPGTWARVAPEPKRKIIPGSAGVRMLVLGGVPGEAFAPAAWTEKGGPTPGAS